MEFISLLNGAKLKLCVRVFFHAQCKEKCERRKNRKQLGNDTRQRVEFVTLHRVEAAADLDLALAL